MIKQFLLRAFPLKITSMSILFLVTLTSCDDENNLLVTEKEIKTSNSRFELSLKIDPDIVYSNSSTKLITSIKRLVPKDSLGVDPHQRDSQGDQYMRCKMNAIGGALEQHSPVWDYIYNGVTYYDQNYSKVFIADTANSVWEGLAFFIPSSPLKDTGHISAIFDGMNLTLPIKLVPTP